MITRDTMGFNEDLTILGSDDAGMAMNIQSGHPNGLDTLVIIKDHNTGEVVFRGKNKTMLAGSEFLALRMFDITGGGFTTPTYNTQLGLENTKTSTGTDMTLDYKTCLFCIGKDGCNRESAIWYPVENKKWIDTDNIIPFQYVPASNDLDAEERKIYFGRKTFSDESRIAYYFKAFDSDPIIKKQFADGTPWTSSVYSDTSELKAQVSVTNTLSITKADGRDYFINTSGINDGRFNSIELCAAWGGTVGGYTYYQDIRPITRINFPNKYLNDLTASWDIIYTIYF